MSSPVRLAAASSPRVRHEGRCESANIRSNWRGSQYRRIGARNVGWLAYADCAVASVVLRQSNDRGIRWPVEQKNNEAQGDGD